MNQYFAPANKFLSFDFKPLPLWLRIPNALAEKERIISPCLTPENLIKAASINASLPAYFPSYLEEALEVLCRSLADEAKLHWFGKITYWNLIVTGLSGFLQVEQAFRDDPLLINTQLINPLIVTGLPRSGTTFLHRILSSSEKAKGIELYRHIYPVAQQPDFRLLSAFVTFEPWRLASGIYNMDAIHYMRYHLPDECNISLRMSIHSLLFWSMSPTYSYLNWLLNQDLKEAYQFYRKVLIIFQKQLPEKRLILKCPSHLGWLPSLVEALPEAHIVQTHRDPLETLASLCKLTLSLHALATNSLNWRKIVNHVYFQVDTLAQRSVAFSNSRQGTKIFNADYGILVKDTESLVSQINNFFCLPVSDNDVQNIQQYIANNRQNKHGRHFYSLEQFDFSPQQIMGKFENYRNKFIINSILDD